MSADRAVFRLPAVSLLIPFLFFICVTPLATAAPGFLVLYLLPIIGMVYVLITRTIADASDIRTTGLLGRRRIEWGDLDGFEFSGPRWAIAVGLDGRRFRLPMVRPRDIPSLAAVSGGRLLLGRDAPAEDVGDETTDAAVEDVAIENVAAVDHAVEDEAVGAQAVETVAVGDQAVESGAVDDVSLDGGAEGRAPVPAPDLPRDRAAAVE